MGVSVVRTLTIDEVKLFRKEIERKMRQIIVALALVVVLATNIEGYEENKKHHQRRVKFAVNAVNAVRAKNSINAKYAGTATNAEKAGVAKYARNAMNAKDAENAEQALKAENVKYA